MRIADLISGLVLAAAGLVIAIWVIPAENVAGEAGEFSSAFLPGLAMISIAGLAVLQAGLAGFGRATGRPPIDRFSALFIIAASGVLALALWLIATFGFVIGGMVLIGGVGLAMFPSRRARWWLLAVAIALPVGSYALAWYGLRLSLP
jgi:ABC-type transport system involved in multi-copper enzyme maturation permease subunit